MNLRIWASAALVALLACATAQAAPVTVNLRVEGSSSTIFEGPVTTDGKQIDKGDGPHPCDGTNGGAQSLAGADHDRGARRRADRQAAGEARGTRRSRTSRWSASAPRHRTR